MGNEIIEKKSEQIHSFIQELKEWTDVDFEAFDKTVTLVRSSERNLELLVELSSDINNEHHFTKTEQDARLLQRRFPMAK